MCCAVAVLFLFITVKGQQDLGNLNRTSKPPLKTQTTCVLSLPFWVQVAFGYDLSTGEAVPNAGVSVSDVMEEVNKMSVLRYEPRPRPRRCVDNLSDTLSPRDHPEQIQSWVQLLHFECVKEVCLAERCSSNRGPGMVGGEVKSLPTKPVHTHRSTKTYTAFMVTPPPPMPVPTGKPALLLWFSPACAPGQGAKHQPLTHAAACGSILSPR